MDDGAGLSTSDALGLVNTTQRHSVRCSPMQIFSSHRPTWLQALAFQNTSCGCRFLAALTCSLKPSSNHSRERSAFRHLEGYRRINDANRIVPSTTELPAFAADRSNLETLNGVDRSISRKVLLVLHGCGEANLCS